MTTTRTVLVGALFAVVFFGTATDAWAFCGDGVVEGGEECDPGGTLFVNGDPSLATCTNGNSCFFEASCCKFNCQFVGQGPDCFDANDCTENETCNQLGQCTGGTPSVLGSPCDDGLFCTQNDACDGSGTCVGTGDPCAGGGECQSACNEALDNCVVPEGTACGDPTDNDCTDPDTCSGGSCQPNDAASGTSAPTQCSDALECTSDQCDGAGGCQNPAVVAGSPCGDPTDDACANPDSCDGNGACLGNDETPGTPCGDPTVTECSAADTCDGTGSCAANDVTAGTAAPALCGDGLECTQDVCDGNGGCTNPALGAGTACGDATDTDCTNPDTCDGAGACVANHEAPGTAAPSQCGDGLECTSDECDGSGGCQSSPLLAGTPCGDPTVDSCTLADTCNGTGACSSNDLIDGAPCTDGDLCTTGDQCVSGLCVATPVDCDDANPCTADSCSASTGLCISLAEPDPACKIPRGAALSIIDRSNDAKDNLKWKWVKGEETLLEEFGDPLTATQYDLCVYDTVAGVSTVASRLTIVPSGAWQLKGGKQFRYKDRAALSDGVSRARFRSGPEGRASVSLKATGVNLPTPIPVGQSLFFELDPTVAVQLSSSEGVCWASEFTDAFKNTTEKFKTRRKTQVN